MVTIFMDDKQEKEMGKSKLEIIKKRIEKLNQEDFDLEAWQATTYAVLMKILSPDDPRLTQINQLKVDYGSWALRDATSKYNPVETAKKKGKEILESIADEVVLRNTNEGLVSVLSAESFAAIMSNRDKKQIEIILKKEKKENLIAALIQLL